MVPSAHRPGPALAFDGVEVPLQAVEVVLQGLVFLDELLVAGRLLEDAL